ncbi:MAG: glycosyltransferase [Singulisphaera sp.]
MPSRVVFLSWPPGEITGGIKFTFRCAEILQENGIAAVVATDRAQGATWFSSSASVIDISEVRRNEDVLVFPENHHGLLEAFAGEKNPKIVFCQNPYGAHRGLGRRSDYGDFGVTHIIGLGAHATRFCRRRFPRLSVLDVQCFIDHKLFCPPPTKRLQIAFIPKKRPLEAMFIQDFVRHALSPQFRDIPWIRIENMSENQVARVMQDSAIFLSLSRFEAYGFNILEAMLCGCVVVGFTGTGALEFATAANGFFVAEDDCMACAESLKDAIQCVVGGGKAYQDLINEGVATGMRYQRNRFAQRFMDAWKQIGTDLKLDLGLLHSAAN